MKALSVRAPWSWAILHLGKLVENRDWTTNFRGKIYLHQGKSWKLREIEGDIDDISLIMGDIIPDVFCPLDEMRAACGCIVGTVEIVDCVTTMQSRWFSGYYGFVLRNPVAFCRPVPFKGALGLFDVPDDFLSGVMAAQNKEERS